MAGFKVVRWSRVLLLFLAAGLICIGLHLFGEPLRRTVRGVEKGVYLRSYPVEGLLPPEVALVVAKIARVEGRAPVDAVLDQPSGGIIPEMNGVEVDQELTVRRVMEAPSRAVVDPVYREVLPAVRVEHYPTRPLYQGNPRKGAVALMINVAWVRDDSLEPLLAVLDAAEARGTFFLTGRWAEQNPELVQQIVAGGHELGNHGYADDVVFSDLDAAAMALSLRKTNEIVFDAAVCYPRYFTPHKGEFNPLTLEVVSRHALRTVLWSLDTVDWQNPGAEAMQKRILEGLAPGKIILMHPTGGTVQFLEETLPEVQARGLTVVTVAELLSPSPFLQDENQLLQAGR